MSWGTCYSGSNNIHFNFPPLMNDSRNVSNYEPGGTLDNKIKKQNNIENNSDYRNYLQQNADSIIKNNQMTACEHTGVCSFSTNTELNGSPYIFKSSLSNNQPFGYQESDLKNIYLSKQELDLRKHAPRYNLINN